jgi:hypothetical protein
MTENAALGEWNRDNFAQKNFLNCSDYSLDGGAILSNFFSV